MAAASSARASKLAAFGLTEPEAGSDAGNTRTRATLDDGEWVIDGAKQFITNAGTDISGCVTITAVTGENGRRRSRTSSSPTALPATRPASRTGRWAGTPPTPARSASTAPACPRRTCSGRRGDGFKQFLHILDGGRIGVAAMGVGLAQGALDEAIAYAKERRAFGQPISQVPGDPGEDRRHLGADRGRAPAHLQVRRSRRTAASRSRSPPRRRS